MEAVEISKILEQLTVGGKEVVSWYAHWYFWASVAYMVLGNLIIYLSFWLSNKLEFCDEFPKYLIRFAGLLIGLWVIFAQIPDLVSPYGIGARQLIRDISGK